MKYKFSPEALNSMATGISRLQETPEVRKLYNKLHNAYMSLVFHKKVSLTPEELEMIRQALGKSDGTIGQWGYQARRELAQYGVPPVEN